jgi:nucleotide-binding universal stress UspA family protein
LDFETNAKIALVEALAEVSGQEPDVPVRPLVAEGAAADVLLHAAKGADLLVVGSRAMAGSRRRCSVLSACTGRIADADDHLRNFGVGAAPRPGPRPAVQVD